MSNLWVTPEELGAYTNSDYAYEACKSASYLLWGMSGRKFSGVTTVTERYVSSYDPYLRSGGSSLTYTPTLVDGNVVNIASGGFNRYADDDFQGDGTSANSRVRLRGRKVVKVHTLRDLDGNIIEPNKYYLSDHSTILGVPGSGWSPSQVEVTYTYGSPPPSAGRAAARVLATELVKLYEDDDTCALPQRVTSISRQGVSYTLLDNQDFIDELKTGIYAIDLFLKTVNPDKARARTRVFSPDQPRARRITGASPLYPLSAFDLYSTADGASNLYYFSEVNADFLDGSNAWTIQIDFSDINSNTTTTITNAASIDRVENTIRVSATYKQVLDAIGPRDPGILDMYAVRPSLANPAVDEIVPLISSNIIMQLGERTIPIHTV
jgi:hypothetical protein